MNKILFALLLLTVAFVGISFVSAADADGIAAMDRPQLGEINNHIDPELQNPNIISSERPTLEEAPIIGNPNIISSERPQLADPNVISSGKPVEPELQNPNIISSDRPFNEVPVL